MKTNTLGCSASQGWEKKMVLALPAAIGGDGGDGGDSGDSTILVMTVLAVLAAFVDGGRWRQWR